MNQPDRVSSTVRRPSLDPPDLPPCRCRRRVGVGLRGLALAGLVLLAATSCGGRPGSLPRVGAEAGSGSGSGTAAGSGPASGEATGAGDPLDAIERRVAEAVARVKGSVLALEYTAADAPRGPRRVASGVVIGEGSDVLSVRIDPPPPDSAPIVARDAAGQETTASWVAADPETGLTLLSIAPQAARPAVPARRAPAPGQPVLVVGNPFGLGHSVSRGAVAGLDRRLELGAHRLGGLIQVDASLHPGDSGALLVDLHGGWLGVIRSGLASPGRSEGADRDHDLGFAITAGDALWVAGQLRAHRRVDRAYLGVIPNPRGAAGAGAGASSTPAETASSGVALDQVLPDSPADRAGLKPGDRLVALDGRPIHSTFDLDDRLARTAAGAEVAVAYLRGEGFQRKRGTLTVRTGLRPPTDAPAGPDRSRPKAAPPPPAPADPALLERLDRLERRVKELEAEKARRTPPPAP